MLLSLKNFLVEFIKILRYFEKKQTNKLVYWNINCWFQQDTNFYQFDYLLFYLLRNHLIYKYKIYKLYVVSNHFSGNQKP